MTELGASPNIDRSLDGVGDPFAEGLALHEEYMALFGMHTETNPETSVTSVQLRTETDTPDEVGDDLDLNNLVLPWVLRSVEEQLAEDVVYEAEAITREAARADDSNDGGNGEGGKEGDIANISGHLYDPLLQAPTGERVPLIDPAISGRLKTCASYAVGAAVIFVGSQVIDSLAERNNPSVASVAQSNSPESTDIKTEPDLRQVVVSVPSNDSIEPEPEATVITINTISEDISVTDELTTEVAQDSLNEQEAVSKPDIALPSRDLSFLEKVHSGETRMEQHRGQQLVRFDAPSICLEDVSAFISNKVALDSEHTLNALQEAGHIDAAEKAAIINGTISYARSSELHALFDRIYQVHEAQTPQEDCGEDFHSEYGPRWERGTLGSNAAEQFDNVGQIAPIIDIDYRGVAPGQRGNVVSSAHHRTANGAFSNLDGLEMGDEVSFTDEQTGQKFTYVITHIEEVLPTVEGMDKILNYSGTTEFTLTMYTCDDGSAVRLVVRAELKA